ncbi:hypothetical protein D3P96_02800 [Weissella viridescens]|uniref:Uncharacterized protein n=1 Tax=Weissella viridescens TaxID=1629 RepID=A0A3P2RCC1_WEIVI|nr:hypothetical protein D3P96_02800 [Weissella viridescens]
MNNVLIDIYKSCLQSENTSFYLSMENFPNTSAPQIEKFYHSHGINVNVTMHWGFYRVQIKN